MHARDLRRETVDVDDMYLILARDGIWDVMSNDDVGEFVARRVEIVVQVDAIQGIRRSVHAFNVRPILGKCVTMLCWTCCYKFYRAI